MTTDTQEFTRPSRETGDLCATCRVIGDCLATGPKTGPELLEMTGLDGDVLLRHLNFMASKLLVERSGAKAALSRPFGEVVQ